MKGTFRARVSVDSQQEWARPPHAQNSSTPQYKPLFLFVSFLSYLHGHVGAEGRAVHNITRLTERAVRPAHVMVVAANHDGRTKAPRLHRRVHRHSDRAPPLGVGVEDAGLRADDHFVLPGGTNPGQVVVDLGLHFRLGVKGGRGGRGRRQRRRRRERRGRRGKKGREGREGEGRKVSSGICYCRDANE